MAVFLITFLAAPLLGAGWFWDAGNAIGFAALAGLLYLTATGRGTPDPYRHHWLGQGVLVLALAHAFWFLLGDPVVVVYLRPGAPAWMWAGVAGLLVLGALATGALLPRRWRPPREHPAFRRWHRGLAIAAAAAGSWHVLGSGFYLQRWYQWVLLAGLVLAACWPGALQGWLLLPRATDWRRYLLLAGIAVLGFAGIRSLPA